MQRASVDAAAFADPNNRLEFYLKGNRIDSIQHIRPRLREGMDVALDRYVLSTFIGNMALGASVGRLEKSQVSGIVIPDATVFLALDEEVRIQRVNDRMAQKKATDSIIDLALEVQKRVGELFDQMIEFGLIRVYTTGLTPEEVTKTTVDRLSKAGILLTQLT